MSEPMPEPPPGGLFAGISVEASAVVTHPDGTTDEDEVES